MCVAFYEGERMCQENDARTHTRKDEHTQMRAFLQEEECERGLRAHKCANTKGAQSEQDV